MAAPPDRRNGRRRDRRLRDGRRDVGGGPCAERARNPRSSSAASGCATAPETRDPRAIFQRGVFRPQESWIDGAGEPFNPGNYYYVGGNSKFYGAVLIRYRAADFKPIQHAEGVTPGWPFAYDELEPWYGRAEALYQVRGDARRRPHRAAAFDRLSPSARAGRAAIAAARERMRSGRTAPVLAAARN